MRATDQRNLVNGNLSEKCRNSHTGDLTRGSQCQSVVPSPRERWQRRATQQWNSVSPFTLISGALDISPRSNHLGCRKQYSRYHHGNSYCCFPVKFVVASQTTRKLEHCVGSSHKPDVQPSDFMSLTKTYILIRYKLGRYVQTDTYSSSEKASRRCYNDLDNSISVARSWSTSVIR